MELRQLRYFIAVAEHLSFSKAAHELHVTVPPLSRQIRQLEDELDAQLFMRDRRHVALTDAGRALLREAKVLVDRTAHVSDCVRSTKLGESGLVRVGIGPGLGARVSRVLVEHSKRYPAVELQCREMFSGLQNQALVSGETDVAFFRPFIDAAHLVSEVVLQQRFVVQVSRLSPLAKRRTLRMKDLEGETLLLPSRESCPGMYDKTLELYAEAGISPNIVHVPLNPSPNSDSQIVMVACRKGIFVMPDEMSRRPGANTEIVAVPLDEPNACIDVHMAWRKDEKSKAVIAFLESARRVFHGEEEGSIPRGFIPHPKARHGKAFA